MAKTKRSYTPEFRADALRQIFEQGRSAADVGRNLDVPMTTLHGRLCDAKKGRPVGSRGRSPEQEDIARLRRELRNVDQMSRDVISSALRGHVLFRTSLF
jgi:transposase